MSAQHEPSNRIPRSVPSAMDPSLANTPAGEMIRANEASSRLEESLAVESEKLRVLREIQETGNYRQVDENGNPVKLEAEKTRVAAQISEQERRVNALLIERDRADAFASSLEGWEL